MTVQVMAMNPNHWAWKRNRPAHHIGAIRSYARDLDFYDLRGPYDSPRGPCDQCASVLSSNNAAISVNEQQDVSWYLSSSSTSPTSSLLTLSTSSSPFSEEELQTPGIEFDGKQRAVMHPIQQRFSIAG